MKFFPIIISASILLASCSSIRRADRELNENQDAFSSEALEGYWMLSKVRYQKDGRQIEDIRTRSNTIVIGVSQGAGNAFEVSSVKFVCNNDQPINVRHNLYFEFSANNDCNQKSWLAQKIGPEFFVLRDLKWSEPNAPREVDLEFTKVTPKEAAVVIYRVVKPGETRGAVFAELERYKTELNQ